MNYLSKASISINVYGDNFNPSEFTKLINIQPTNTGIRGKKGRYIPILKESFWEYRTKKSNALEELDESIRSLVLLFEGKFNLIKKFTSEKGLNIKCYIISVSL